jgi:transcriptional regulator GlxA family with amidase domain
MTRMPVFYQRQAGKQTKQSVLLDLNAQSDRIQVALAYAQKHLATQLGVEELAAAVHLSVRHFSRLFRAETDRVPSRGVATVLLSRIDCPVRLPGTAC